MLNMVHMDIDSIPSVGRRFEIYGILEYNAGISERVFS